MWRIPGARAEACLLALAEVRLQGGVAGDDRFLESLLTASSRVMTSIERGHRAGHAVGAR